MKEEWIKCFLIGSTSKTTVAVYSPFKLKGLILEKIFLYMHSLQRLLFKLVFFMKFDERELFFYNSIMNLEI